MNRLLIRVLRLLPLRQRLILTQLRDMRSWQQTTGFTYWISLAGNLIGIPLVAGVPGAYVWAAVVISAASAASLAAATVRRQLRPERAVRHVTRSLGHRFWAGLAHPDASDLPGWFPLAALPKLGTADPDLAAVAAPALLADPHARLAEVGQTIAIPTAPDPRAVGQLWTFFLQPVPGETRFGDFRRAAAKLPASALLPDVLPHALEAASVTTGRAEPWRTAAAGDAIRLARALCREPATT